MFSLYRMRGTGGRLSNTSGWKSNLDSHSPARAHICEHIGEHTYKSTQRKAHIRERTDENTEESTHMRAQKRKADPKTEKHN